MPIDGSAPLEQFPLDVKRERDRQFPELRKAAKHIDDVLWQRVGESVKAFAPEEGANYFRRAGFGPHCAEDGLDTAPP